MEVYGAQAELPFFDSLMQFDFLIQSRNKAFEQLNEIELTMETSI